MEQMDSNEFIDGDGRITAEEMKVFESFAA